MPDSITSMLPAWRERAGQASQAMVVLVAFSLAMPTAWSSAAMLLFLLFWLSSGDYHQKWLRVKTNPAAWTAIALFLLLAIGTLWSTAEDGQTAQILKKYHKLLYVPLLVSALVDDVWRRRAIQAFVIAVLIMAIGSYLQLLGWLAPGPTGQEYAFTRGRITHNFFLAFAAYLVFLQAMTDHRRRWIWLALLLVLVVDLIFVVQGRTGQIVFLVLMAWYAIRRWQLRGLAVTLALVAVLMIAAYQVSDRFKQRADATLGHIAVLFDERAADASTLELLPYSRVIVYQESIDMILRHPWWGTGTGSFRDEYAAHIRQFRSNALPFENPHSEYLNFAVHLGVIGVVALVGWFVTLWRVAGRLAGHRREAAHALILAMSTGCLFNSFLMDRGEGSFFVVMVGILLAGAGSPGGGRSAAAQQQA